MIEELRADPHRFDFFQALRLVQNAFGEAPALGSARRAEDEPIRLRQEPSLNFAPSTLWKASRDERGRLLLSVLFLGFTGPNGALPTALTEFILDRRRIKDYTLSAFLDIFHHRALTQFFRAWALNNQAVDFERPEQSRFTRHFNCLLGTGTDGLGGRDALPEFAKLFYAGHLIHQTRHAEGLAKILSGFFDVPCEIEEFAGQWLPLPEESISVMGQRNCGLGSDMIAGTHVWNCQMRIRVTMGPVSMVDLYRLLPSGPSFKRLRAWVDFYCGYQLQWDLQIIVKRDEVPAISMSGGAYLGWTTWSLSGPAIEDGRVILSTDDFHEAA